eukprot:SAG11_NODE_2969_length_2803_cov_14.767012_1_plen_55_part_10
MPSTSRLALPRHIGLAFSQHAVATSGSDFGGLNPPTKNRWDLAGMVMTRQGRGLA